MQRKFIFKDNDKEFILPITPSSFTIGRGRRIETINIHTLGDVNIAGNKTLDTISVDCIFPAQKYHFAFGDNDPYDLVAKFEKWIDDDKLMRFIISDTPINIAVKVENIEYGEKDGTNDIYATISLREIRDIKPIKVETSPTQNLLREESAPIPPVHSKTYTIVRGDTLSSICRKFYGNANLYPKLATVNNIKNPNLIIAGNIIRIPEIKQL